MRTIAIFSHFRFGARLPPRTALVTVLLAVPLLAGCGTVAVAGVPDSLTVYGNGHPVTLVANLPTAGAVAATATPFPTIAPSSTPLPTSTALPTDLPSSTPTQAPTAIPATAAQAAQIPANNPTIMALPAGTSDLVVQLGAPVNGDPANGMAVFNQVGCSSCHNVANASVLVGPALKGVAVRALTRKPGYSAVAYLRESILYPNAYVVSGFQPNIMPQNWGQRLTPQQLDDIVSYLLTLNN